jgi:cytochrome P450
MSISPPLSIFPSNLNTSYKVLPFSAGARACIGIRFALSQSVAILANLIHTFEISLPSEVEIKLNDMEARGIRIVERMEWLSAWSPGVTNTPQRAKVRVKRRTKSA